MYRRITASCIILFMLVSGFRNENFEQTGLLGKSVTLRSGVNQPGNLIRIEWSIFNNESYIAVLQEGKPRYFRHQSERLKLNITTGDLEIMDLHKEDSGTYTVHVRNKGSQWDNKVILSVQEGLPEPNITVTNSTLVHGLCKIFLTCSLKSKRIVNITWGSKGFPHGCVFNYLPYATAGQEIKAWCSPTQDVNITCTANDSVSTSASTVTTGCSRKQDILGPADCPPSNCFTNLLITLIIILMIIIICFLFMYIKHDALCNFSRRSWVRLTDWLPFRERKSENEKMHGDDKDKNNDNNVEVHPKETAEE